MEGVTNVIRIASNSQLKMSPEGDFFKLWVEFLKPVHKLTEKEMEVLALYLKHRYMLEKTINDPEVIDNILMSLDTRKIIREQCGIKNRHLNVILSKFRKNGVIRDGKLYQYLIPTINKEGAGLMICFSFKDEPHFKFGNRTDSQKS